MLNKEHPAAGSGSSTSFQPYIPASVNIREFTPRALIVGAVLGMIFGASSLYLVLKVGLTVSASIPVAVISVSLFRLWSQFGGKDATILENNIVQTAGSAGESLAFGIGVTMPAILILGFDLEVTRVTLVAVLGGLLGIMLMIPLRRALIVEKHGELKYPEGTACAEVLKVGASEESKAVASDEAKKSFNMAGISARTIFAGFLIGLVYKTLNMAFKGWKEISGKVFGGIFKGGSVAAEVSPELLGVGYIIGPRISCIMFAGGALSYLVLIPLISYFGEGLTSALPPAKTLISSMSPGKIRGEYILYIGAGAVAAGGIISMIRSLPTIWHGIKAGLADFRPATNLPGGSSVPRTDRDLSMKIVAGGIVLLLAVISLAPRLHMNILGAILIVTFGFLFVTVSSRLCGEIGSSSNPVSGMTVATLLLTCLVFLMMGWVSSPYYVTALSVGAIVCIAASNGGATSQDLKTGFLVGATPKHQQVAIIVGALLSALLMGPILLLLNKSSTVYVDASKAAPGLKLVETPKTPLSTEFYQGTNYQVWHKVSPDGRSAERYLINNAGEAVWLVDPGINGVYTTNAAGTSVHKFDAPKALLMSYIIKGILDQKLPWALVLFGVMIAVVLELCGISSLAFAVGVYLPISSSAPIFVGGLVRWLVDLRMRRQLAARKMDESELAAESDKSPGVLMASGYIAGGAIAGILLALVALASSFSQRLEDWSAKHNPFFGGDYSDLLSLIPFAVLVLVLYYAARGKSSNPGAAAGRT